eukprot:15339118-Ditylum_brightwellii.AAC.1
MVSLTLSGHVEVRLCIGRGFDPFSHLCKLAVNIVMTGMAFCNKIDEFFCVVDVFFNCEFT